MEEGEGPPYCESKVEPGAKEAEVASPETGTLFLNLTLNVLL